jgi:hypothetical protein
MQEEINELVNDINKEFRLDRDQSAVLARCANWFVPSHTNHADGPLRSISLHLEDMENTHSFVQVDGIFGSGKSMLLVAIASLVVKLTHSHTAKQDTHTVHVQGSRGTGMRILMVSPTDEAVDSVMQQLLNSDISSIARCGNSANIGGLLQSVYVQQNLFTDNKW